MEGSASEAVFFSLNLNPQLFINEVISTVDDLADDAFDFFHQQASTSLKIEGTERAEDLSKGIDLIRKMVQSNLDERLAMWKQYCLNHCFEVPEGFMLPKSDESPVDSTICQNAVCDPDLDAQLDLLRSNLNKVSKESAALNQELQSLERQSASSDRFSALVNETLQLYDQNSSHEMFQEMVKAASELQMKIRKLKAVNKEETKCNKTDRIYNPHRNSSMVDCGKGFSGAKLEDLQEFLSQYENHVNFGYDSVSRAIHKSCS